MGAGRRTTCSVIVMDRVTCSQNTGRIGWARESGRCRAAVDQLLACDDDPHDLSQVGWAQRPYVARDMCPPISASHSRVACFGRFHCSAYGTHGLHLFRWVGNSGGRGAHCGAFLRPCISQRSVPVSIKTSVPFEARGGGSREAPIERSGRPGRVDGRSRRLELSSTWSRSESVEIYRPADEGAGQEAQVRKHLPSFTLRRLFESGSDPQRGTGALRPQIPVSLHRTVQPSPLLVRPCARN